jgi:hypothetical protein
MRAWPWLVGGGVVAYAWSRRRAHAPSSTTAAALTTPLPGRWVWPVPRWDGRAPAISRADDGLLVRGKPQAPRCVFERLEPVAQVLVDEQEHLRQHDDLGCLHRSDMLTVLDASDDDSVRPARRVDRGARRFTNERGAAARSCRLRRHVAPATCLYGKCAERSFAGVTNTGPRCRLVPSSYTLPSRSPGGDL